LATGFYIRPASTTPARWSTSCRPPPG